MLKVNERRRLEKQAEIAELIDAIGGPGFAERFLRVSPDTVKRWLSGQTAPPWAAIIALRAGTGRLPGMEHWPGWHFSEKDGLLYAPGYTRGFSAGEMLAWHYKDQLIKALQRDVEALREKLESREAVLDRLQPAANERRINHA
jgi:hypothetical protein